ncbi:MAG: histidinol-phosphate transaminase [Gemmatimonadota bacterium]
MGEDRKFTRRHFVGGAAAALGALGIAPGSVLAEGGARRRPAVPWLPALEQERDDYDALAKINFNENPYGPSEKVMEAMNYAFKYSMRYGYPDGGITQAIADHHGVARENVLLGAGSGEILEVVGLTYLDADKMVVGVEPSYGSVYSHASGIDAEALLLPLEPDYTQNIGRMIDATRRNARDVGFVYLCNPNNPTGLPVSASDVQALLDGIPEDIPVLIDEAYHHFVEDPGYATSIPHVLEGRRVIVARTFSKIYGMAAMRLGYAIAPADMVRRMAAYSTGSTNALVKWGGAAALADTESEQWVRETTLRLRKRTTAQLENFGYEVIPSDCNFFMVNMRRPVQEVSRAFRERDILVGRPFPPMLEHLRVSVGTEEEMDRFLDAFEDLFVTRTSSNSGR